MKILKMLGILAGRLMYTGLLSVEMSVGTVGHGFGIGNIEIGRFAPQFKVRHTRSRFFFALLVGAGNVLDWYALTPSLFVRYCT